MDSKAISDLVNQLAESVILTEADDPSAMAQLHTLFEQLAQLLNDESKEMVPIAVIKRCVELIESLIFNELPDSQACLDDLGKTVGLFQEILSGQMSLGEAIFPDVIGYASSEPEKQSVKSSDSLTIELPPNVDEAILIEFLSRQPSELEKLEQQIMELEKDNASNAMGEIKRMVHTLKGETGLLGLTQICDLCHVLEDTIANKPVSEIIEPLLTIKDWLERIFGAYAGQNDAPQPVGSSTV